MNKQQEGIIDQAWRIVRRRKFVILQAAIVVPLLALLLSLSQQTEYTASALLLFRPPPTGLSESTSIVDPTREAATNGELVGLPVVAERAAESLNEVSGGDVASSVEVTPSLDAETATVAATTPSPTLSAEMANAYGRAYIGFRREADRAQVQNAIELAEESLAGLTPAEREGPEQEALNKQLDQLRLTQALQTGGAELVQTASPPGSPSSPNTKRNVLLGLILGLLLGFGLAALLERLDRRVRSSEELEEIYGLPLLAKIPRSRLLVGRSRRTLGNKTAEGEAFRVLRTNLRYFNADLEHRSILVVSPEEGDGKSTVAHGLATTMAEMGDDVVLVEADLRKGSALRQPGGKFAAGLSNALTGTPLDRVLVETSIETPGGESRSFTLLPSGPPPPNPSALLETGRMTEVLDELGQRFQFAIIDSPATGAVADALTLVPMAQDIVIVASLSKTTRSAAGELKRQFSILKRQPTGVVVNFAESEHAKYSNYYQSELDEPGVRSS